MKTYPVLSLASLVLLSGTALAQDAVKADPAHYKVVLENPSLRVLKIDYSAGAKSSMHQHPDTIVIPLVTSNVRFATPDGKSEDMELVAESAMYAPAMTHSPQNIGKARIEGLLIEFKSPSPGTATLPEARAGMAMKVLAEGPRAVAHRMTADASFSEPAGSKHEYDQVVIALSSGQISLTIDGKAPKTTWARGDVAFIGRGVPHESKNASGKPLDFIIVTIK